MIFMPLKANLIPFAINQFIAMAFAFSAQAEKARDKGRKGCPAWVSVIFEN
jgi:hypothetical protein